MLAVASLTVGIAVTLPDPGARAEAVSVPCSVPALVAAIDAANRSPGADTVRLSGGCVYTLTDPNNEFNGLPEINSDITIQGGGATITRKSSASSFRIIFVAPTGTLTLNDTTISGGRASDCPALADSGIVCGGGISNTGSLFINHSKILDNTAVGDSFVEGGGIDNQGEATIKKTEISGNSAVYTGGFENAAFGGGIANDGPLTVDESVLVGNVASLREAVFGIAGGAGLANFSRTQELDRTVPTGRMGANSPGPLTDGPRTITDTVFRDNHANAPTSLAWGGGIFTDTPLALDRADVSFNRAAGANASSGGIYVGPSGALTLAHSAVRGNTASGIEAASGGGIGNSQGGTVTSNYSSIDGNTASSAHDARGGGIFVALGGVTLNSSRVAGNRADDGGGIFNESGSVVLTEAMVLANTPNNCRPPGSIPGCTG